MNIPGSNPLIIWENTNYRIELADFGMIVYDRRRNYPVHIEQPDCSLILEFLHTVWQPSVLIERAP
jgi:hypothetical protein